MLSERISALFSLLQCSNTDVARYAECSPSNISRLKSGSREAKANSRTVRRVARGAYRYAREEALVPVLCALCGTADSGEEQMVRALAAWLCAEGEIVLPRSVVPKSRRRREKLRERFGERLTRVMDLLGLTNVRLAGWMNVDVSLVSRWRSGAVSLHGNDAMKERLGRALLAQAERLGRTEELAALCGAPDSLAQDVFLDWLMGASDESPSTLARMLLHSLDSFAPGAAPAAEPRAAEVRVAERYWGTEGLRDAAVRFLNDAAREGGELLLYSDEAMDWLSGDAAYFALWAELMVRCVKSGVTIRVIHNLDRNAREMVAAISGWFPLYISGAIEPFVLRRTKSEAFRHTFFLRVDAAGGGEAILGCFPARAGERRWYEYVTDAPRMDAAAREFDALLSEAVPFLRTYPPERAAAYREFLAQRPDPRAYLLSELPVVTMPEDLLARMLAGAALPQARREALLAYYRARRARFTEALRDGVHVLLSPPDGKDVHYVNFCADFIDLTLPYKEEEYAEHVKAVAELLAREEGFRITPLPAAPFKGLQIVALRDAVAVLRRFPSYAVFTFTNNMLTQSVEDYFAVLLEFARSEDGKGGEKGDCAAGECEV